MKDTVLAQSYALPVYTFKNIKFSFLIFFMVNCYRGVNALYKLFGYAHIFLYIANIIIKISYGK